MYDGLNNNLTPDKLQLPPHKKRKGNNGGSAASTPVNQGATPGSGASPQLIKLHTSPEQKRQPQMKVEQQQQQEQRFKCPDEYCSFSTNGFEKEEELQAHTDQAHKKIENALDFFLNSTADALDVNVADGTPKAPKVDPNAVNRGKDAAANASKPQNLGPATMKREALKVEGQTPGKGKGVAAPSPNFIKPMSPIAGRTPNNKQSQQTQQKPAEPTSTPPKKTMLETMAEKAGITLPKSDEAETAATVGAPQKPPSASPVIVGEDATGKDTSLAYMNNMAEALKCFEPANFGDADMEFAWSDPSPALTPSSSQSGLTETTTNTNISANDRLKMAFQWDAWGMGNAVQFPFSEGIGLNDMGLQSSFDKPDNKTVGQGMDTMITGTTDDAVPWTWNNMFHAGAGLDHTDQNWDRDAFGNSVFANSEFFNEGA